MPRSPFMEGYQAVVDALVAARHEAGLTQAELAERLGKPQSFVSKIERGERRVDVLEFCQVARALGRAPSALMAQIEGHLAS